MVLWKRKLKTSIVFLQMHALAWDYIPAVPWRLLILKKSLSAKQCLNFGCCYDRMSPTENCNLSDFAKTINLQHTEASLFLATRGRQRSLKELVHQKRVNSYRFGLLLLLEEEYQLDGFVPVGDAPAPIYKKDFADYAMDRISSLNLQKSIPQKRILSFWNQTKTQQKVHEFFICNVLRNLFARPLEVLILLDRCLKIEESGAKAEILTFFDHQISPRNLGILQTPG